MTASFINQNCERLNIAASLTWVDPGFCVGGGGLLLVM